MTWREALRSSMAGFNIGVLPSLVPLQQAARKVAERWPEIRPQVRNEDRQVLALEMLDRVEHWHWQDVQVRRVIAAAVAVFDEIRRRDLLFAPLHEFYFNELDRTAHTALLDTLFWIYLESFEAGATHTKRLAYGLARRTIDLPPRSRDLLSRLPALTTPARAAQELAAIMQSAADPYVALKELGFATPHMSGLPLEAHRLFVEALRPQLFEETAQNRLLRWLCPANGRALENGAALAIDALLMPWSQRTPDEQTRNRLSGVLVAAYGDPRVTPSAIWSAVSPELLTLFRRWLSGRDMHLFCDVISGAPTQHSEQWEKRKKFWIEKFDRNEIDEVWVAFGTSAQPHARRVLSDQNSHASLHRIAQQIDRSEDRSLLVMRIGRRIVVDGCNNFKTHIFTPTETGAPQLYQWEYSCREIRDASTLSKSHSSIRVWAEWVNQHT